MAKKEIQTDMTVGSPSRIILNFTVPIFIGNLFQQLYSMADTVIVGKFVGTKALAAVGSVGTIMFLILGFLQGAYCRSDSAYRTEIWGRRQKRHAKDGGYLCSAFSGYCGFHDGRKYALYETFTAVYEYTG